MERSQFSILPSRMVPNKSPTAALSHGRKQSFVQVIMTSVSKRRRGCSGNPPIGSTLYWKRRISALWVLPCRSQSPVWCVVYQSGVCGSPQKSRSPCVKLSTMIDQQCQSCDYLLFPYNKQDRIVLSWAHLASTVIQHVRLCSVRYMYTNFSGLGARVF